jgi:hypothetical protein
MGAVMGITTDPNSECLKKIEQSGMQKCYLVLSDEERAKGFIRPVRRTYKHVGRSVCGKIKPPTDGRLGGNLDVCCMEVGHEGECWHVFQTLVNRDAQIAEQEHRIGGCDGVTTMGQAIAETYARDPKFYGGTFCCQCGTHLPVGEHGEFIWVDDATRVGS